MEIVLALNGFKLVSGDAGSIQTFMALAAGDLTEATLAEWFGAYAVRV